ncbi:MAG TPA: cystathionine beta-lyase [Caulobacteraceae bacterium]|jgi:cystathionine beta-lyase|nr:cystathionine beta-lyase [Caulobacteraceae bacterium]
MGARPPRSEATRAVRAGQAPQTLPSRTVGPPIQRGSTVLLPDAASLYDDGQVTYGRGGLAVHDALINALVDLEDAAGGQLFPSGLAAMTGVMLAILKAGDEVLVVDTIYAPTRRFCDQVLTRFGVSVRYYAPRSEPEALFADAGPATRLVVLESPGSLTFEFQDASGTAAAARERGVLSLMDNTWGAGLLFKPLAHGVDISVQALTKYVCGHSDVFLGSACASDAKVLKRLDDAKWNFGWSVSPDDAYQALRGLRTLPTRMARHDASGRKVAEWLRGQPDVLRILHPAFEDSPDHAIWRRDYTGACGLFAAVLKPAPRRALDALLNALTLFGLGFSWGGFESLAIGGDPQLARRRFPTRLEGPLLRLHVGLEDPDDLIADLKQGLDAFNAALA